MTKVICFDLDNIICKTSNNNYKLSKPIKKNIKIIYKLYKKGYQIDIFTARGMGQFKGDYSKAVKTYKYLTTQQLKKWRVKYHNLILGKPAYDYYIDDKAYGFKKNWHLDFLKFVES
jgi:histidinol phosphatase-like enzyme